MAPDAAIPRADADSLLARLEAELSRSPEGAILASDADGTIWDGDVGIDLFEALLASRGARPAARDALAAEARAVGVPDDGDAPALLARLYDAYNADRYPHDRAFAMMAWSFAGWAEDELSAFCARVLSEGKIEARIRPELTSIFRWAESRGVPVYLVSASPITMIRAAAPRLGIALDRVVAMTPALDGEGRLLPRLAGPIVYGEGKMAALEAKRPDARKTLLGAFGDSTYDAAMLRAARVPVAVTPAPGLVTLLPTIPNVTILAR